MGLCGSEFVALASPHRCGNGVEKVSGWVAPGHEHIAARMPKDGRHVVLGVTPRGHDAAGTKFVLSHDLPGRPACPAPDLAWCRRVPLEVALKLPELGCERDAPGV